MSYFQDNAQEAIGMAKLKLEREKMLKSLEIEQKYANGGAGVSYGVFGPPLSREAYQDQFAFKTGTGRASAPSDFRTAPQQIGGPVQDVQAKGFVPKAYADGGAVVSFGDLAPANFAGRMQVSGPGMKEYNEKYAFGPGTGRTTAPRNFMNERYESPQKKPANARRKLADGGPVQDVQAKGFVPVKVSNGEFEFTPEQVANIGAAMLASKG